MGNPAAAIRGVIILFGGVSLLGCASTQLNYNALDLASTVDSLVTKQVLSNLAKFIDSPFSIPSQVSIASGTVTTNNSITPSMTSPLNVAAATTNTLATTMAAATSMTVTNQNTSTRTNMGFTLAATDQWTQTWGLSPLTDPDQLRRLRVLYQFGAGYLTRQELLCNYPIIGKKDGGGQASATGPASGIIYPTINGKDVTVTFGAPKEKAQVRYVVYCKSGTLEIKADPAFLNPPSCVICADPSDKYVVGLDACDRDKQRKRDDICLHVNHRLRNGWLKSASNLTDLPDGAISLGTHHSRHLYVQSMDDLESFYEFSLFILEATTQVATSATGQSAGKGSASKTAPLLGPPAILLQ